MPLTNVQVCSDEQQCFVHITPEEAEKRFGRASISSSEKLFLCGYCHHYVHFISGGVMRSHFKHDKNDDEKACLERSQIFSILPSERLRKSLSLPMRLHFERNTLSIQIGFLPLEEEYIAQVSLLGFQVSIWQNSRQIASYLLDSVNFSSSHTVFYDVGTQFYSPFRIRLSCCEEEQTLPPEWDACIPALSPNGTLFDEQSLKRIPINGDAAVGKTYYLVTASRKFSVTDVSVEHRMHISGTNVYRVKALRFSRDSAAFFLSLQAFLTVLPTQLLPVWPPLLEGDHCIYSNQSPLYFIQEGTELKAQVYPDNGATRPVPIQAGSDGTVPVLRIPNNGLARMIWSTHADVAILRYMFLRRQQPVMDSTAPVLELIDSKGTHYTSGVYQELPFGKELTLTSPFDGKVRRQFQGRNTFTQPFKGEGPTSIKKLKFNELLEIWIGRICIARIEFSQVTTAQESKAVWLQNACVRYVSFPRRYGSLIYRFSKEPCVQAFIRKALSDGKIRADAFHYLMSRIGRD